VVKVVRVIAGRNYLDKLGPSGVVFGDDREVAELSILLIFDVGFLTRDV